MHSPGIQKCQTCGANLSVQDLTRDDCPYCRTALPHRARAQQQAALVREMLKDANGNGIPDAYEGMILGGGRPMQVGQVGQVGSGVVVAQSVVVHMGAPQSPYMAAQMQANSFAHVNQIQKSVSRAVSFWLFFSLAFTVLILALVFGIVAWSMM